MMGRFRLLILAICVLCASAIMATQAGDARYTEENHTLRTTALKMAVNQTSRVTSQHPGLGFKYLVDGGDTCYMFDGSLLIGTSDQDISMGIYSDTTSPNGHGDPAIGRLYALSDMTFDTLPDYQTWGYRHAYGVGCNRDSSIAFDVDFYAPRHPDSADFMIGNFSLYAGPKNPSATINNVTVCYAVDWNIPDDNAENVAGYDEALQMVYQKGVSGTGATRYGAIAGNRDDLRRLDGGMVLDAPHWVDSLHGYIHDAIWTKIQNTSDYSVYSGPPEDLHSMLVIGKNIQIRPRSVGVFSFYIVFAGQAGGGTLSQLEDQIKRGTRFRCTYLPCLIGDCFDCGDANSDGVLNISDAVFLIAYVFSGGPAPAFCMYSKGKGDANGDGTVNISDAVYLIAYIFLGSSTPHCQGMLRR
jgi:hypothetical protein